MPASQNSTRLSTAKEIALAFGGSGAASASGWHDFRCPAHDDKTASCGVKDDRDGKIAVKCHAGCERDAFSTRSKPRVSLFGSGPIGGQKRSRPKSSSARRGSLSRRCRTSQLEVWILPRFPISHARFASRLAAGMRRRRRKGSSDDERT